MAADRRATQRRVDAALHDPEHRLVGSRRAARQRSAQRWVRSMASATSARGQAGIDQLVERHRHVGAEQAPGSPSRAPGVRRCCRAVEVRGERHAVVVHASQVGQAEDLEAARIGQDRAVPGHEPMQAAEPRDALRSGAQVEVVGVAEDHLGAGRPQIARGQRLHRGLGADRHELRRVDRAVRGDNAAEPGASDRGGLEPVDASGAPALTPPERIGYGQCSTGR